MANACEEECLQGNLVDLFEAVLSGDAASLDAIRQFGTSFLLDRSGWRFTLPDLYRFLMAENRCGEGIGYRQFRQALYRWSINEKLGSIGGRMTIHTNNGKVDNTLYRLEKISNRTVGCQ